MATLRFDTDRGREASAICKGKSPDHQAGALRLAVEWDAANVRRTENGWRLVACKPWGEGPRADVELWPFDPGRAEIPRHGGSDRQPSAAAIAALPEPAEAGAAAPMAAAPAEQTPPLVSAAAAPAASSDVWVPPPLPEIPPKGWFRCVRCGGIPSSSAWCTEGSAWMCVPCYQLCRGVVGPTGPIDLAAALARHPHPAAAPRFSRLK